jgi:hypothetical protein
MIDLQYRLREHGWATLHVAFDDDHFDFKISYMSNALEEFVSSVVALLTGETVARFALIEEPGEYSWTMLRCDEVLWITVAHLQDMYSTSDFKWRNDPAGQPPEEMSQVLSFECLMLDFAKAVANMIRDIDLRYTASDFERTRNPALPVPLAARLRELASA